MNMAVQDPLNLQEIAEGAVGLFQAIAHSAPSGICVLDGSDLRFKWANPQYLTFLDPHYQDMDISGRLAHEVIPNLEASGLEKIMREVAATREPFHDAEWRYEGFARGVTYWHWTLVALPAPLDQTPDLLVQAIEVTQNVRAREIIEAYAHRSEHKRRLFETMLDATSDQNCLFDRAGCYIYANRAVGELLIRPPESMIGRNFHQLGYPYPLAQRLQEEIQIVIRTKRTVEGEFTFTAPSSYVGYYEYKFVPVTNEFDEVEAVAKATRDITERRKREIALTESEERFRLFADSIPQLAWVAHADGWIFWYNQRWYEYTGTTPEQMEGWGWQSVHDPQTLLEVMKRWPAALARGEPFEMIFPLKGKDGQYRPFLTKAVPYRNSNNEITLWFGTNTEITV